MRLANIKLSRRASGFFRLCVCVSVALTLAVGGMALNPQPVQAIGITAAPAATINVSECQPFTIQFTATGTSCAPPPNPFFWFLGAMPAYATLDPNTGLLTGCPKVGDPSATFLVGVSEFSPPFCGPFLAFIPVTINVVPGAPVCNMVINPTFYPVAWEGMPFSMPLSVTGGVGPLNWSATGLPVGLSVTDATNGIISGTPAPGSCGMYTVTATVADLGTCCCPPVSRPFILIVDCWANYPFIIYFTSICDFKVGIGPGLTYGQTNVTIDGTQQATLAGGGSQTFTSIPCESHMVLVDQTVAGPDFKTRFSVKGPYYKAVSNTDNYAYFDYVQEVLIETGSEPAGLAAPPGTGFYAVGGDFMSSAPSPVISRSDKGIKYLFRSWSLPDGNRNPNRDLVYMVSKTGMVKAEYDTYYLLNLKSNYPPIDESSWELKDSTVRYNLSLQPVPMPNFWAVIGGVLRPINGSGSHVMTGPYTQVIEWNQDYTIPIVIIVVILLVFIGLVVLLVLILSRKAGGASAVPAATMAQTTQPVTVTAAGPKEDVSKADSGEGPNFCPKCGSPIEKDAVFCKKCGNKLV